MLLELFLLTTIICFIIDYSGFIQSIEYGISKLLKVNPSRVRIPKPFSCSLCSTFWAGIIYLAITNNFTILYISYISLLAYSTKHISGIMHYIDDAISYIEDKLYKLLNL